MGKILLLHLLCLPLPLLFHHLVQFSLFALLGQTILVFDRRLFSYFTLHPELSELFLSQRGEQGAFHHRFCLFQGVLQIKTGLLQTAGSVGLGEEQSRSSSSSETPPQSPGSGEPSIKSIQYLLKKIHDLM